MEQFRSNVVNADDYGYPVHAASAYQIAGPVAAIRPYNVRFDFLYLLNKLIFGYFDDRHAMGLAFTLLKRAKNVHLTEHSGRIEISLQPVVPHSFIDADGVARNHD
jgi:hypothetical protein